MQRTAVSARLAGHHAAEPHLGVGAEAVPGQLGAVAVHVVAGGRLVRGLAGAEAAGAGAASPHGGVPAGGFRHSLAAANRYASSDQRNWTMDVPGVLVLAGSVGSGRGGAPHALVPHGSRGEPHLDPAVQQCTTVQWGPPL